MEHTSEDALVCIQSEIAQVLAGSDTPAETELLLSMDKLIQLRLAEAAEIQVRAEAVRVNEMLEMMRMVHTTNVDCDLSKEP